MATNLEVGYANTTTNGTTTAYTCSSGKAARVTLAWDIAGPSGCHVTVKVGNLTIWDDTSAGTEFAQTYRVGTNGTQTSNFSTTDYKGSGVGMIAPLDTTFFLAANETVTYTIASASATSASFVVYAVEADVA